MLVQVVLQPLNNSVVVIVAYATLFRIFHVACYGLQSSSYVGLEMPSDILTHYTNQTAFV